MSKVFFKRNKVVGSKYRDPICYIVQDGNREYLTIHSTVREDILSPFRRSNFFLDILIPPKKEYVLEQFCYSPHGGIYKERTVSMITNLHNRFDLDIEFFKISNVYLVEQLMNEDGGMPSRREIQDYIKFIKYERECG